MHKKKNHITSSEDYRRYLDGSMTSKERHVFEKRMLEDDFENEALEGFSEIELSELKKDFSSLSKQLKVKTARSSSINFWRIAASLLMLTAFSFAVYFMIDIDTPKEVAQSKQAPKSEKAPIAHEEEEASSRRVPGEADQEVSYQKGVDKMKEEIPDAVHKRESEEKEQFSSRENEDRLELDLNLDSDEQHDETIIEESPDNTAMTRSIEGLIRKDPNPENMVITEAPSNIDVQPPEAEEEAATEELAISKSLAGKAAGVSIQSSRKSPDKKALKIADIRTITGNVYSSEDDEVLPGVNITMKGTSTGVVTDSEGNYKIEVPEDEEVTLVFSYIGFNPTEVKVVDQETINVNIEPDVTALSEIVVVGYGASPDDADNSYSHTPPRPAGGKGKFRDYINENIKYPISALEEQTKGTVKLKFKVEADGKISDLVVLKSLGNDFDKEAIRLVKEGPEWEPAVENDAVVARDVKVKIRFRPPE